LLDVARWAPNGANRQLLRWLVVNDPAKVHRISEMTIDWMKAVKEKNPALYQEANLEVFVRPGTGARTASPRGSLRHHRLCPKDERTAPPAAMIAIAYVQVAAAGLGLGATFTGSINTAAQSYPPLIELLESRKGRCRMARSSSAIQRNNTTGFPPGSPRRNLALRL